MYSATDFEVKDFSKDVIDDSHRLPVLVDFWAEWCGPCKAYEPVFKYIAEKYGDKAVFGRLNVDENPDIAVRYNVMGIPTTIIFVKGRVFKRLVGSIPPFMLERGVRQAIEYVS